MQESISVTASNCNQETAGIWSAGRHIPQLDGVRGLAILVVTLYRFSKELPTDTWIGNALHKLFAFGDRGVDLFFVLSGFLITGILLDAKGQSGYFKNFFARRSLRIFPLYFAALFLFITLFGAFAGTFKNPFSQAYENQFFLWTYLTNVQMSLQADWCFGYLDHFWSLAVEEHFYLIWPFCIFFCTRKTALRLAIGGALLSASTRIVFAKFGNNGVAPDVLSIFRFDALLIGSALAIQIRNPAGLKPLLVPSFFVFPICLLVGVGFAILDKRAFTISHTLWPLIWASALIWLLSFTEKSFLARLFNMAGLRTLGKYSYAMYVFQSPLIPLTTATVSATSLSLMLGNSIVGNLAYIGIMFMLTYGAALLSWHLLEKHCLKLKVLFPAKPLANPSFKTNKQHFALKDSSL